jgi:hypothetical protein
MTTEVLDEGWLMASAPDGCPLPETYVCTRTPACVAFGNTGWYYDSQGLASSLVADCDWLDLLCLAPNWEHLGASDWLDWICRATPHSFMAACIGSGTGVHASLVATAALLEHTMPGGGTAAAYAHSEALVLARSSPWAKRRLPCSTAAHDTAASLAPQRQRLWPAGKTRSGRPTTFACTFPGCGYAFKHNYELTKHAARHSAERRYVCNRCGSAFKYSSTLGQHRRTSARCMATANHSGNEHDDDDDDDDDDAGRQMHDRAGTTTTPATSMAPGGASGGDLSSVMTLPPPPPLWDVLPHPTLDQWSLPTAATSQSVTGAPAVPPPLRAHSWAGGDDDPTVGDESNDDYLSDYASSGSFSQGHHDGGGGDDAKASVGIMMLLQPALVWSAAPCDLGTLTTRDSLTDTTALLCATLRPMPSLHLGAGVMPAVAADWLVHLPF